MKRIHLLPLILIIPFSIACYYAGKNQATPKQQISFDPKQTTCFVFDMKPGGWTLVTEKNRYWVSEQVSLGKVEWMEAETTTCYRRYPDKSLGEKIILRNEWYQKKKYR